MTHFARIAAPAALLCIFALAGCATAAAPASPTPAQSSAGTCAQVSVVVDFGALDKPAITACTGAGVAKDILASAGITVAGTADYGDQVVCRVNNEPAPDETVTIPGQASFVESCQTLNSVAYWALWVKSSSGAAWEYAQEGVTTLNLADGQSVGLVYTAGTDTTPPQD